MKWVVIMFFSKIRDWFYEEDYVYFEIGSTQSLFIGCGGYGAVKLGRYVHIIISSQRIEIYDSYSGRVL